MTQDQFIVLLELKEILELSKIVAAQTEAPNVQKFLNKLLLAELSNRLEYLGFEK